MDYVEVVSKPGLSWDAMFKRRKIKFELIPDPDMYIFFEEVQDYEFLIIQIDIAKPTINI